MEETKKQHGGKRSGAGRPEGLTKTLISLKLDNDLVEAFKAHSDVIPNKSKYICDAVRQAMKRDKIL